VDLSTQLTSTFFDDRGRVQIGRLEVVLGAENLDSVTDDQVFEVESITVHESYKSAQTGQDIGLIKLKRPYAGPVARISLDPSTDPATPPGAQVRVAGFGDLKFNAPGLTYRSSYGQQYLAGSKFLREVAVPTVATDQCKQQYPNDTIGAGQLCAGLEEGGKDSCQGDSGGPLVAYDSRGCPFQVGVVSWGAGCAGPKDYGVYTRISFHKAWITQRVGTLQPVQVVAQAGARARKSDTVASAFTAQALQQLQDALHTADRRLRLEVKGGNRVALGSEVVFVAQSEIAGRLIIVDINAAGEVLQILPNKYTPAHSVGKVAAGVEATIPGPDYGFTGFKAVEPLGKGTLVGLVVPEEFPIDALVTNSEHLAKGFVPVNTPTNYLMNLVQQVSTTLGKRRSPSPDTRLEGWALATTTYEIVR
jgi:hypothetical protein